MAKQTTSQQAVRGDRAPALPASREADPETFDASVRPFVRMLSRLVAAELPSRAAEDWVDQHGSPFGRRRHCELARSGAFPAHPVGRQWLVRRAHLDAYIEAHRGPQQAAPRDTRPANDAAVDEDADPAVLAVLAEAGLELEPKSRRAPRGRR